MIIRSITVFIDPKTSIPQLPQLAKTAREIQSALQENGYDLQGIRLATTPFPEWLDVQGKSEAVARIIKLEKTALSAGFAYLSIGPASVQFPGSIQLIPDILAATQQVFCTSYLIQPDVAISTKAIRSASEIICANSRISPDGFANLRYSALANVRPGSPFFPAAYHSGAEPAFAFAIDGASLAVEVFGSSHTMEEASTNLIREVEGHAARLENIARSHSGSMRFLGIDFTLAPYPETSRSIGEALERLGVPVFGGAGSLAASAFLMSTLDQAHFTRTGFNGLMLPVLEDNILAERAADGCLSIQKLLLYSCVCGTGLDCIPLPGDIPADEIYPILLDLAALSARLKKQLTARLMPVPGKQAGEMTEYTFDYFANSRILPSESHGVRKLLAADSDICIQTRNG
jgi:uncharacterized protein